MDFKAVLLQTPCIVVIRTHMHYSPLHVYHAFIYNDIKTKAQPGEFKNKRCMSNNQISVVHV